MGRAQLPSLQTLVGKGLAGLDDGVVHDAEQAIDMPGGRRAFRPRGAQALRNGGTDGQQIELLAFDSRGRQRLLRPGFGCEVEAFLQAERCELALYLTSCMAEMAPAARRLPHTSCPHETPGGSDRREATAYSILADNLHSNATSTACEFDPLQPTATDGIDIAYTMCIQEQAQDLGLYSEIEILRYLTCSTTKL